MAARRRRLTTRRISGTARAFQISETTGAFAALAMGLNGLLTAILLPILIRAWGS